MCGSEKQKFLEKVKEISPSLPKEDVNNLLETMDVLVGSM